jgi:MFS family permease
MPRFILFRSLLIFLLVGIIQLAFSPTFMTALFLVFIGFTYAIFYILMISLSMELIPEGKTGFFDGLVGLGAAAGSFLGPFLAEKLSYIPTFLVAAVAFLCAFLILKIFAIKN